MKPRWLLSIAVASVFLFLVLRATSLAHRNQEASQMGQTLSDLSRALDEHRERTGRYPDSLLGLHVDSQSGDYSKELLGQVVYVSTGTSYVAFLASGPVSYITPGKSPVFKNRK